MLLNVQNMSLDHRFLRFQVIIAQHDKIQNVEAAALESVKSNDQRLKKAGKSNIDRWLHVLLDEAFPRISPDLAAQSSECQTNGQPPLSPDLSALSMAAIRGSVELEEGRGSPVSSYFRMLLIRNILCYYSTFLS